MNEGRSDRRKRVMTDGNVGFARRLLATGQLPLDDTTILGVRLATLRRWVPTGGRTQRTDVASGDDRNHLLWELVTRPRNLVPQSVGGECVLFTVKSIQFSSAADIDVVEAIGLGHQSMLRPAI